MLKNGWQSTLRGAGRARKLKVLIPRARSQGVGMARNHKDFKMSLPAIVGDKRQIAGAADEN